MYCIYVREQFDICLQINTMYVSWETGVLIQLRGIQYVFQACSVLEAIHVLSFMKASYAIISLMISYSAIQIDLEDY